MTSGEILGDIRMRLGGLQSSVLHGENGLAQATMNAWAEASEDLDAALKRVRKLEATLHTIAAIAKQDVDRAFVWLNLDKIATIATEAMK